MKYTLITGASSGIGLCYAEQFAAKGENIIVVSNQEERNEEVAADLKQRFGVEAVALYADLSKADSAELSKIVVYLRTFFKDYDIKDSMRPE